MKIYFFFYLVLVIFLKGILSKYLQKNNFRLFLSFDKNPNEFKMKLDELRKQFESCQDMISRVEGIDTTIDDQRSELDRLDNELKSKTELLKKHIQMCKFDLNMPPKTQRIISETEEDLGNRSLRNAMNINDDDDDDLFQPDDNTNTQQQTHNENLSSFFP